MKHSTIETFPEPVIKGVPIVDIQGSVQGNGFLHVSDPTDPTLYASVLPKGTSVEGDILCGEDTIVEGHMSGRVTVDGVLLVESTGEVRGQVIATRVAISGLVIGSVQAVESIHIGLHAKVIGDLRAPVVQFEKGASFHGHIEMDGHGPK